MGDEADIAARVRDRLSALGVDAEEISCDPQFADTAAFCARYGIDPADSANCIVVAATRGERRHVACVVLATTRLDVNGAVRRVSGFTKASFADAAETAALTGMLIGGVTPFGLPEAMPLYVDARVLTRERVVIGGGDRSRKLRLAPQALLRLPNAALVDGLALPPPGAAAG